jgi:hypothetical protein
MASAQGTASITGSVTDVTGGTLPGVTVQAASPALIEKVRTAFTDDGGRYAIPDLPPGAYVVTFALRGFGIIRREGIQLTTGFAATIDAELAVGDLAETVIVSGAPRAVDLQNVRRYEAIPRDVIDAVPSGRNYRELATLIPGVQLMDGGRLATTAMGGVLSMDQFPTLTAHGSRTGDTTIEVNGLNINVFAIRQDSTYINFQDGNVQEYAFEVAAHSAESESGGVRVNLITRDGGNTFSGSLTADFATRRLQSSNMTGALRAQGLGDPDAIKSLWSLNPSIGGPIVRDALWFYGGYARIVNRRYKAAPPYINTTPAAWRPTFDETRQIVAGEQTHDANVRLVWQAAARHKLSFYYDRNILCQCPYLAGASFGGIINTLEASHYSPRFTHLSQASWHAPVTARLLFEAAASIGRFFADRSQYPEAVAPRIREASNGLSFRAPLVTPNFDDQNTNNTLQSTMSYVTGTHVAKMGGMWRFGRASQDYFALGNMAFDTLHYRPTSVTYYSTPYSAASHMAQMGLFVQDQWAVERLSLNLGLRYDYYTQGYPDIHLPAVEFVPEQRDFPGATIVRWYDLSPRLGVAYTLSGAGKTVVKASLGRFVLRQTLLTNPARANTSMTRTWTDPNGDFVIQGDPLDPRANGELGPSTNLNFGEPEVTDRYDDRFAFGVNRRPFNWETSVSIEHEVVPKVVTNVALFRRWFGNFQVLDNLLVGPGDYDTYCVTAPVDARLPSNVSGHDICGLYDLNPAKVGRSDNRLTSSTNYGRQAEHWNGVDVAIRANLANGVFVHGGLSSGQTMTDSCEVAPRLQDPTTRFCRVKTPLLTQIKAMGAYRLPWGLQVSATLQSFPGPAIGATAVYTSGQVQRSLGRPLSSSATAVVELIAPRTRYAARLTQVDLRVARIFTREGIRVKGWIDFFNLFNANTVQAVNTTYGPTIGPAAGGSWLVPTQITSARLMKVGVAVEF